MKKLSLFLLLIATGTIAQVKFTANIANRNSDTIYINGKNFKKVIPINKQGVFESSFSAPKGMYQMYDGVEYAGLFLADGYDLTLKMDARQFDESIVFSGKGAKENNFLAQQTLADEKLEALMTADATTFGNAVTARAKSDEEKLGDKELDESFRAMMSAAAKQQSQMLTMMYMQAQAAKKLQGNASPAFDYENHKGGKTKLADLKGKYVYIDTWATWCGPCRAEIPHLKKVEEKYHDKKIEFVSISIDTKKDYEKWKKFVDEKQLGGIQLFADNDWNSQFIRDFSINSIPRFILIDPQGNVVNADAPRPSSPEIQQQLDKLLN
ncbi:MAG TPA: TlpA disulfide reductase family protein [Flavobacterium sp.]